MSKFGVVVFPGSNCDHDAYYSLKKVLGYDVNFLWHKDTDLKNSDVIILPGGFSYGDYLRAGAVARFSPVMESIMEFADKGGLVLGICNGFQALVRLGLLPAATGEPWQQDATLTTNDSGKFEDRWVHLQINAACTSPFVQGMDRCYLPVRHGEGKFIPRNLEVLHRLQANHQIAARYCTPDDSATTYPWNPNGSVDDIAAVCDVSGRIFGLMPHPEAYVHRLQHPRWTRESLPEEGMGVQLFRNAVAFAQAHLL